MYKTVTAFLLCIIVGMPLFGEEISLSSLVPLVLENDPAVQLTRNALSSSLHGKDLLVAATRPQITASQAPTYSFSSSRYTDPLSGDITTSNTHGVSASVNLTQVLPTDGALSASISDSMTVVTTGEEVRIDQSPRFSVSVSQPVFTNRKLIDLSIYTARRALMGDMPVSRAELQERIAGNTGLLQAFAAYKATFVLRGQVLNQDANLELASRWLELSRLRGKQGSITPRDLWEEELAFESLNEVRLELKYTLMESEQNLARRLGMARGLAETSLSPEIPVLEIGDSEEQLTVRAAAANPDVLDGILAKAEAEHNGVLNGREFSSDLTFSFSVTPKYSPSRTAGEDFASSVSDFFDDDAYAAPALSIGISIPVYDGGKAKHRREIDRNAVSMAEANLAARRRFVVETMQNLLLRRSMLQDKLDLVVSNLSFEKQRLEEKQRLLELNQTTTLEVDRVRLKASEKELEIWATEADLFLNAVRILAVAGYDLRDLFEDYI
jgi:outer membrane protein TolC